MKENLIVEVKRIHEIMGVKDSKKLLMEGPIIEELIKKTAKLVKDLGVTPHNPRTAPEVPAGYTRVGKNLVDSGTWIQIERVLSGQRLLTSLSDNAAFSLGRILAQDPDIVDSLYKEQMRRFMQTTKRDEATALRLIYNELPNNQNDLRRTMTRIFNDPNDPNTQAANMLSGILYSKIEKRLVELSGTNFKIQVFAPEGPIKNIIKNLEPPITMAFRNIFGPWITNKNLDWFNDRLSQIADRIEEKLNRRTSEGNLDPEEVIREVREMFNTIVARRLNSVKETDTLLDTYIWKNPNIPDKVKEELKTFGYVNEITEKLKGDISLTFNKQFLEWLKRSAQSIPLVGQILTPVAKKAVYGKKYDFANEWLTDMVKTLKRTGNQIAYSSPFTFNEILARSAKNGKFATIIEKIIAYLGVHNFLVPAALQELQALYTNTEINNLKKQIKTFKDACEAGLLIGDDCSQIDEIENYTMSQWWDGFFQKVPVLKLFGGDFEGTDLLFFTYLDEVYKLIKNARNNLILGDQDLLQQYRKELTAIDEKYKKQIKKWGVNPDNAEQIEELKQRMNIKYPNSPDGFKKSVLDAGGDPNLISTEGEIYKWDNKTYKFIMKDPSTGQGIFEMEEEQ